MSLNDLFKRAGASDQNREAWLAERRNGITATEAKRLMLGETYESLSFDKLNSFGVPDNELMAWGREREPVIADHVRSLYPEYFLEHRVFTSTENPRFLASPDLLGEDETGTVLTGEIKTSGLNLDPNIYNVLTDEEALSWYGYEETGYEYQQQWVMMVCESPSSLFVWEKHSGDWVDQGLEFPKPSHVEPIRTCMIYRNDEIIAEMKRRALEFLTVYDEIMAEFGPSL